MGTASQLQELRLAIHGVNAPFFSTGSCAPQVQPTLRFKKETSFVVQLSNSLYDQVAALKPLIDRCKPATFGDNRENRLDRTVRDALQLKAEKGAFSVSDFDPESAGILESIRREMLPPGSSSISAELYALNIYTRGGHFAPHKDTPRGADMFGTLVVCLPSYFLRGHLSLMHRGVAERFDWGADLAKHQTSKIYWAAFFGDVDHQIEQVRDGARVTLTYLLRRDQTSEPPRAEGVLDIETEVQKVWQELLADASFFPNGGTIGYPCCHLYHQDARFQIKQKPLEKDAVNMLKGRDHLVAAAALHAGLKVEFSPYLFETCIDETWQMDRFPTGQEKKKLKSQMALSDLESALPITGESSEKVSSFGITWLTEPPTSRSARQSRGDTEQELPVAQRLHSCEYCEWGYFGNEASDVDFYIYAALHIKVPSFNARQNLKTPSSAPKSTKSVKASVTKQPLKKKKSVAKKVSTELPKPSKTKTAGPTKKPVAQKAKKKKPQ